MTNTPPSEPNQPGWGQPPGPPPGEAPPPASGYPPPSSGYPPPGPQGQPAGPYGQPGQPAYQQQGYGYTQGPVQQKNNGKAVAGFVCSLVGLLLFGVILGTIAVILGAMGKSEIQKSGGAQKGSGLATAAIVIGIIDIVAFFILLSTL